MSTHIGVIDLEDLPEQGLLVYHCWSAYNQLYNKYKAALNEISLLREQLEELKSDISNSIEELPKRCTDCKYYSMMDDTGGFCTAQNTVDASKCKPWFDGQTCPVFVPRYVRESTILP